MAGQFAHGTELKITVSEALKAVAGLTSISGLDLSADEIDYTAHDSPDGYREFGQGLKDAGSVEVEGNFFSDDSQEDVFDLFESGDTVPMEIVFPSGLGKWEFDAFVSAFSTDAPLDDKLGFTATFKVSGQPTLTVTAPEAPAEPTE